MQFLLSKLPPSNRAGIWLGILPLVLLGINTVCSADDEWEIDSQSEWKQNTDTATGLATADGMAEPTGKTATFKSVLKRFDAPKQASSISIGQSPVWESSPNFGRLESNQREDARLGFPIGDARN